MKEISQLILKFNEKEVEISQLQHSCSVLYVDLQSICPQDGKEARAEQLTTLSGVIHEKVADEEFVNLVKSIKEHDDFSKQSDEVIRKIQLWDKEVTISTSLNKELVQKLETLKSKTNNLWQIARESLDEIDKQNYLDSLNELFKAKMEEFEYIKDKFSYNSIYDYFLDSFEENMTQEEVEQIFSQIKENIVSIVENVESTKNPINESSLKVLENWKLSPSKQEKLLTTMFNYLNLKPSFFTHFETTHPFMISLGPKEVRVGVAYRDEPLFSFSSGTHEAGHALYEHNQDYKDTILGTGTSMGIHESQSLFWESHIATSKPFLSSFYNEFQEKSNGELDNISFEEFYAYVNRVSKSMIRIEGDELTYPLHIIIRFEIEKDLFAGNITVYDIEEVWNEKYKKYFKKEPQNFKEGFMQDVHWSEGMFGYFPTYLLGRVYASQIEKELRQRISNFDDVVSNYEFEKILHILREEIHKYGRLKTNKEVLNDFLREEGNPTTYIEYLEKKFNSIYNFK